MYPCSYRLMNSVRRQIERTPELRQMLSQISTMADLPPSATPGLAGVDGGRCDTRKGGGRIAAPAKLVRKQPAPAALGISHAPWPTRGEVNDESGHPHFDASGKLAVVHNGVIENYQALKDERVR